MPELLELVAVEEQQVLVPVQVPLEVLPVVPVEAFVADNTQVAFEPADNCKPVLADKRMLALSPEHIEAAVLPLDYPL